MTLRRLDAELVRRGLARSRDHAQDLIKQGCVEVKGSPSNKPSRQVDDGDSIRLVDLDPGPQWVSRGAHKLLGALAAFPEIDVSGKVCLDAGASTGGFTQVLLENNAQLVYAVDVGYGQLAWVLQSDERVDVRDRTNVRHMELGDLDPAPSLVVSDLSFISLKSVLPALIAVAAPNADFLLMVKPQFEVGKSRLGKNGVVRDPELRIESVRGVADAAHELGVGTVDVAASPLPGPKGNVEYFLWLRSGGMSVDQDKLRKIVETGPS